MYNYYFYKTPFHGHASFTDTTTIKVTEKNGGGTDHVLNGKYILVATGAEGLREQNFDSIQSYIEDTGSPG